MVNNFFHGFSDVLRNYYALVGVEQIFLSENIQPECCPSCLGEKLITTEVKYLNDAECKTDCPPEIMLLKQECSSCQSRILFICVMIPEGEVEIKVNLEELNRENYYKFYLVGAIPEKMDNGLTNFIPEEEIELKDIAQEGFFCLNYFKFRSASYLFKNAVGIIIDKMHDSPDGEILSKLYWMTQNLDRLPLDWKKIISKNSSNLERLLDNNWGEEMNEKFKMEAYSYHDLFISIISEIYIKPYHLSKIERNEIKLKRLK